MTAPRPDNAPDPIGPDEIVSGHPEQTRPTGPAESAGPADPADLLDPAAGTDPDGLTQLLDDERITDYGRLVEASGRLDRILTDRLRAATGLSAACFEVMLRLGRSPRQRLRMSELADQLWVTTGGATRLIDRVVAEGLVKKQQCPEDRRVQWVTLTAAGRSRLAEAAVLHLDDLQHHVFDRLDPDDLPALRRSLDRLRLRS